MGYFMGLVVIRGFSELSSGDWKDAYLILVLGLIRNVVNKESICSRTVADPVRRLSRSGTPTEG